MGVIHTTYEKEQLRIIQEAKAKAAEKAKQQASNTAEVKSSSATNIFDAQRTAKTDAGVQTPSEPVADSSKSSPESTSAERNYSEKTCNDAESLQKKWQENVNAKRPDGRKHFDELVAKGKTVDEAAQHLCEEEANWAKADAEMLRGEFEKNSELRRYYQENFTKLPARLQKALLVEAELRVQNGENLSEEEKINLLKGVKNSSFDDVKGFSYSRLEKYGITEEDQKRYAGYIKVTEAQIKQSKARNTAEAAVMTSTLANGCSEESGQLAVSYNENQSAENQKVGSDIITKSETYKNSEEVQETYADSIPRLEESAQVHAHKAGVESEYTTEKSRNSLNAQIRKMNERNQREAFANANNSEKMSAANRQYLASQIRYLHQSNQAFAMRQMIQNQMNQQHERVMQTLAKEMENLQVAQKDQQELLKELKETGKIPDAILEKIEKVLTEKALQQGADTSYSATNQSQAQNELIAILYQSTGNHELASIMATGGLTKNASVAKFADLLDKGTLSPELVINAGYKNSLTGNFSQLTRETQDKVFDLLTVDEVMDMYSNGKFPSRFEEKVKAKLQSKMTISVASSWSQSASFSDLVTFKSQAKSETHKKIFERAITQRFSDRLSQGSIFSQRKC